MQGQATYDNWVTTYKVKYTEDSYTWNTYQENGVDKVKFALWNSYKQWKVVQIFSDRCCSLWSSPMTVDIA